MAEQINLTEWLAKAKEDPKLAAQPVIIILAIFFGGYKALYAPNVKLLERAKKTNKRVEDNIKKLESAVENIEDIKLVIEEKKSKWKKAKELCYRKSELTKFLRRIREIAKLAGVPVKSVNPGTISAMKIGEITVEQLPVSIFFTGDLVQLGIFLRLLEKEKKITYLKLPTLSPNASGTFEVELTPTTILISDELAAQE
ncbi:MAG: hypothetical protein Kow0029_16620 [Candidatus Rifleibacteriota bacterium]